MKKVILVLLSVISASSFACDAEKTTNAHAQKTVLGQHALLATTVDSAKNSAAMTNRVAVIAKTVTASIG